MAIFSALCVFLCAAASPGPLLLVDDARLPRVTLGWDRNDDTPVELRAERPYTSPEERGKLGHNLEVFVALGGTRLDAGAGHPDGAIVRVGLYKENNAKPFFEDMKDAGEIHIHLEGVYFNQPIQPRERTILQHVKYVEQDLAACGLGGESINLYNTADPEETLYGKITKDTGRMGVVNARKDDARPDEPRIAVEAIVEPDGSLTLDAKFSYALLRHVKDPWVRTAPGSFQEPTHFHIEIEVLPKQAEGAEQRGE